MLRDLIHPKALQADVRTSLHTTVPEQYIFTEKPSKSFLLNSVSASTYLLRHWSCSRAQPTCGQRGAAPAMMYHGMPWCGTVLCGGTEMMSGSGGSTPQGTQDDKVAPVVEVEFFNISHWMGNEFSLRYKIRHLLLCYFKCLPFLRRQQKNPYM